MKQFAAKCLSAVTAAAMLVGGTNVFAQEDEDYITRTENVIDDPYYGEDVWTSSVILNEKATEKGYTIPILTSKHSMEPGGSIQYKITLGDETNTYNYVDGSARVTIPEYNYNDAIHTDDNGRTYSQTVCRSQNPYLYALGTKKRNPDLSDAAIGALLKAKGYGTELEDEQAAAECLDDYYLDCYNEKYGTDITDLKDASTDFLDQIFSGWSDPSDYYDGGRTDYTGLRETNETLAELGYYYLYNRLLTIDRVPVAQITEGSDEQKMLDAALKAAFETDDIAEFTALLDGEHTQNCYQGHWIILGITFDVKKDSGKISEPDLTKYILKDGEKVKLDTINKGDTVKFQLTSHVPEDLIEYVKNPDAQPGTGGPGEEAIPTYIYTNTYTFTFHDEMDKELVSNSNYTLSVNGKSVNIPSDYVKVSETKKEDTEQSVIDVDVNLIALFHDGYFTAEEFGLAPIVLAFTADAVEDLAAGAYYNNAWVIYQNGETETDTVTVETYKIVVYKYDQSTNAPLEGAQFSLYNNAACKGTPIAYGSSDEDGYVYFDGLKAGTYYLKETKPPFGYIGTKDILPVEVKEDTADYTVSFSFANTPLVNTGGSGTMIFTITGLALLACGAVLLVVMKRKSADQAK